MISNSPDTVSSFRELVADVDLFLGACQTGEIDPKDFSRSKRG